MTKTKLFLLSAFAFVFFNGALDIITASHKTNTLLVKSITAKTQNRAPAVIK